MTAILTIHDTKDGPAVTMSTAALAEVPGMQFSYGSLGQVPGTDLGLGRGVVPAGAEVPLHASPDAYAMYVVTGQGTLVLQSEEGGATSKTRFAPGMVITFPPGAQHGWQVDEGAPMEWFGIEIPAAQSGAGDP